jgi:hypothetical protein
MTDLEENCWSEKVCQTCGSQLPSEPLMLTCADIKKKYCSELCHEQGLRLLTASAPEQVEIVASGFR